MTNITYQAELKLNDLNQELTKNLNKRKAQIEDELANVAVSDEVLTLQQRKSDLSAIVSAFETTSAQIKGMTVTNIGSQLVLICLIELKKKIEEASNTIEAARKQVEKAKVWQKYFVIVSQFLHIYVERWSRSQRHARWPNQEHGGAAQQEKRVFTKEGRVHKEDQRIGLIANWSPWENQRFGHQIPHGEAQRGKWWA